jgi:polysaccharide export outer membrane protein
VGLRLVLVCVLVAILGGCSRTWDRDPPIADASGVGMDPDGTVVEGPEATASIRTAARQNGHGLVPPFGSNGVLAAYEFGPGYRIGSGDRLTIRVLGQTDLTNDYIVDGAGNISLPLINTVKVGGLTAPEAERLIAARLREGYLRAPSVSVQVTNLRPFYILGEVNQAGSYPYQSGMTVQNAIAIAEGYSARANQGDVLLTRKSGEGTMSSRVPVTTQIYPGDIIYIRERWF